jgi:hypothetical protein
MPAGYLIWTRGLKGPEASKWSDIPPSVSDYWKHNALQKIALDADEFELTIEQLAAKYPAPAAEASQ